MTTLGRKFNIFLAGAQTTNIAQNSEKKHAIQAKKSLV